jgi:hypothetical protein
MNNHELPEDLERWPREPYQILGVKPGVNSKDLRLAYTRLIRRFKPEQFPEHFRRIREAYDQIQFFARFTSPPETTPTDNGEPKAVAVPAPKPFPDLRLTEDEDIDVLWRQACQGGNALEAYRELSAIQARQPQRTDVIIRLYWLLWTLPSVDPGQDPCHWLVQGLRQNATGPCFELYHREIEQRPAEALGERCNQLLEWDLPLPTLAALVEWRWLAAGAMGQWEIIAADIKAMRPRFAGKDDMNWVRLLLIALDQLAWVPAAADHVKLCSKEIDQLNHVHAYFDLSRLDVLHDLARAWQRLNPGLYSSGLLRLIARGWNRPFSEFRVPLLCLLEEMLTAPEASLAMLDRLHRAAPVVLGQFGLMVDHFRYQPGFPNQQRPDLDKVLGEFLQETSPDAYPAYRLHLFRFMQREALLSDQVLQAIGRNINLQRFIDPNNYHQLSEDWPLRIMCVGQCAFWG